MQIEGRILLKKGMFLAVSQETFSILRKESGSLKKTMPLVI